MAHVQGRQSIGVNQPPGGGSDYPFVKPSDDVKLLLADFYLAREHDLGEALPLYASWLYGFGTNIVAPPSGFPTPAHARDVVIKDGVGEVVFDSTVADYYTELAWGGRLLIIEWRTDVTVCRCVAHTEWPPEVTPAVYDNYITPAAGELDPRTHTRLPLRVTGLRVGSQLISGAVRLEAGYNVDLSAETTERVDGSRLVNRVNVDAIPGAGLGRRPGCEDTELFIRTMNRAGPDKAGNFRLEADSCVRLLRPLEYVGDVVEVTDAALLVQDDCRACCECSQFVRVYKGLKVMWDRWLAITDEAEQVRDLYQANRRRWLDFSACVATSAGRLAVAAEKDCKLFAGGSLCNPTACCLTPVELRFTFARSSNGVPAAWAGLEVLEAFLEDSTARGERPYTPMVTGQVVRFTSDYADPRASTSARFRACMTCAAGDSVDAALTAHVPSPSGCDLARPSVPAWVSNAWAASGVPSGNAVTVVLTKSAPLNPNPATFECGCGV